MALCQVQFSSEVLRKKLGMYVILPEVGEGPFPVFYLLHGLSDDHTTWLRRTRIEWYVRSLPLIVVMPDGLRGFYTNHDRGPAYATYLTEELPAFVERFFPASTSQRCIGGLSMGGYGALRIALGHPGRYVSANSHSGAVGVGHFPAPTVMEAWEWEGIFGTDPRGSEHDLLHLAGRARDQNALPKLRIDCGRDDFLIEHNRFFHRQLREMDIPHDYEEFPGAHDWDYWDLHVQEALRFHCGALGI